MIDTIVWCICWQLLISKGSNLEAKDAGGWTPLVWASSNGDLATVEVGPSHQCSQ